MSDLDVILDAFADRVAAKLAIRFAVAAPTAAPLLTAKACALALPTSDDTFARRIAPEAPHVVIGSRRMYDLGEVRAWLASRKPERAPVRKSKPRKAVRS